MNMVFKLAIASIMLALPTHVGAQVLISEVMYDVPGADTGTGGEWVEIHNGESSSIELTAWIFVEANTNHRLTVYQGSPELSSGGYAVIVNNPELFLSGYPNFSGTILDSSFSLANEGEALALKDAAGGISDEVNYSSSEGGAGDGNSLNRERGGWRAALPTPGEVASSEQALVETEDTSSSKTSESSAPSAKTTAKADSAKASASTSVLLLKTPGNKTALAGAAEFYDAEVFLPKGVRETEVSYQWNFGNGVIFKGRRPFHAYAYPGSYVVTLEAYARSQRASARFTVAVEPAELSVTVISPEAVSVTNESSREVDLSLWSLRSEGDHFIFPEHTIILPHTSVTFTHDVTGLRTPNPGTVALLFPSGEIVEEGGVVLEERGVDDHLVTDASDTTYVPLKSTQGSTEEGSTIQSDSLIAASDAVFSEDAGSRLYMWLLGLTALLLTGLGSVLFLRKRTDRPPLVVHGYEIVEDEEDDIKT